MKVGVSVRFVPAGLRPAGKDAHGKDIWHLHGAMVLAPTAVASSAASVELETWPQGIEALVNRADGGPGGGAKHDAGFALAFSPAKGDRDGGRPMPVAPRAWLPAYRTFAAASRAALAQRRGTQVTWLTARWKELLGPSSENWQDLAHALNVEPPPSGGQAPIVDQIARTAPDQAAKVPDIIANGRGEMGLLLALERGRSVLDRMKAPAGRTRMDERLRTRAPADQTAERSASKPWLTPLADAGPARPRTKEQEDAAAKAERLRRSMLANEALAEARRLAVLHATHQAHYATRSSAAEVGQALRAAAERRPSCEAPAVSAACTAESRTLTAALDRARTLHFAAAQPEADPPAAPRPLTGVDAARSKYFAIQSQPTLARLFNLVIDVVVMLDDVAMQDLGPAVSETVGADAAARARYAFVTARLAAGAAAAPRVIWTAAKLRTPADNPKAGPGVPHFWACTREELDARAIGWSQDDVLALSIAPQLDGLLDLGAAQIMDGAPNPRFDLATLDIPRASEADLHADARAAQSPGRTTAVGTATSGGLVLVDRWRQQQAVAQAMDSLARRAAADGTLIVDVEDLTVGLKLDVGLNTSGGSEWRSLVERRITFGEDTREPGQAARYADAIDTLLGWHQDRQGLNSAVLTLPARLRANADGEQEPGAPQLGAKTAFVEEVVAQWNGAPLGADLHANEVSTLSNPELKTRLSGTGMLELSQTYSLPRSGAERPPRLCFGWPYRVGVRPQLAGGIAVPLGEARRAYESGYGRRFALPATGPGRRALRHERVEAPVVTTPLRILQRAVDGPQETATELVVRSAVQEGHVRTLRPAATHRVVVPPPVTLDFADRHDVFIPAMLETGPLHERRPHGGLRDVAFDRRSSGTFPVWSTQASSDGALYPDDAADPSRRRYPEPTGDAVFAPRDKAINPAHRRQPYYPDPAADLMVFRLRREDGSDPGGRSLVVRTRRIGVGYPDVTPVVLEVVAGPETPADERLGLDIGTQAGERLAFGEAAWTIPAARVFIDDGTAVQRKAGPGLVEASRVVVRLAPGERFMLDIWCLPLPERLSDWFDLVESAILAAQASGARTGLCLGGGAFVANLAAVLATTPQEMLARVGPVDVPAVRATGAPCGAGQLPLPGRWERDLMAQLIQQAAMAAVMPELAARATIWVTHAIDRPVHPPSFESAPEPGLVLRRVDAAARAKMLTGPDAFDPALFITEAAIDGSTDVILGGFVRIDHGTTGFIELSASGACLVSGAFDDTARGRSADDRARGIWPDDGVDSAGLLQYRDPRYVFGFIVAPDGTVSLPAERATLIRLDLLPAAPPPEPAPQLFDLLARQCFLQSDKGARGVSYPQTLADTKARVLNFTLATGSNTAAYISRPDGASVAQSPKECRVALPSTKAPARVLPMTILPAFRLEQYSEGAGPRPTVFCARRTTRLRVRVRRPWFSSGQGERLGVVLWPPAIFDGAFAPRTNDQVTRDYDVDPAEAATMDMSGFSDLDLGPGGAYISRWGADPTNGGRREPAWLIPPSAFTQVDRDTGKDLPGRPLLAAPRPPRRPWSPLDPGADADEVVYVPRATMPIPGDPTGIPGAPTPTMEVALLAYRPRFDIDAEHWYFDVEIDPLGMVEPFVRLGLVRYQANAPKHLRVSEPVVEWAQLLPPRTVTVGLPRPGGDGFPLTAAITGPAWSGADPDQARPTGAPMADPHRYPVMNAAVYRRGPDGIETLASLHDLSSKQTADGAAPSRAERTLDPDPGGLGWQTTFHLADDPADGTCSVVVWEVHRMRPASYAAEPFDPASPPDEDILAETGPRFAARVSLRPGAKEPGPERMLPVHGPD